ncbi:hypothetical protein EBU24_03985 [bacterium]|nr:hypothetical protein [bacterium]
MKTEVKEVEFKVPNKKDILRDTALDIIEKFKAEHGADWKLNCHEAIDNEIMKFQGSLEYWKGIRKLIK